MTQWGNGIKRKRIEMPMGNGETMLSKKEIFILDKVAKRWGLTRLRTVAVIIKKHLQVKGDE